MISMLRLKGLCALVVGHGLAHIISYLLCELRDVLNILLVHQNIKRQLIVTMMLKHSLTDNR